MSQWQFFLRGPRNGIILGSIFLGETVLSERQEEELAALLKTMSSRGFPLTSDWHCVKQQKTSLLSQTSPSHFRGT